VLREQAEKLSPVICLHENKDFKCLRKGWMKKWWLVKTAVTT
jgi:hypothetical protein